MQLLTVVLSYNHPQITERCLRSCLQWIKPEHLAILHNGSSPKHRQHLMNLFPQITHWNLDKNRGYTGGINEIFRRGFTQSPWLFVLTNDTELKNTPHPPAAPGFYGPLIWARKTGRVDSLLGKVSLRAGQLSHNRKIEDLHCHRDEKTYVPGTAFFLHKESYSQIGQLDENLGTYWDDVDYSLRAHKLGVKVEHHDATQVLHHVGKTCHKDPHYSNFLYQRNRRWVCRRHVADQDRLALSMKLWMDGCLQQYHYWRQGKKDQLLLLRKALKEAKRDPKDD